MKLAIISDTHFGVRNDNHTFIEHMKKFLDEVFFPYIDKHKIKAVFHLGDLVDRRRYVNYVTLNRMRTDFLQPLSDRGIEIAICAGNHDTYYKDTNKISCLQELLSQSFPKFKVFLDATEVVVDGIKILMVPWINNENRADTLKMIKKTKAQICFGHLQLTNFEMDRGHVITDGEDPELFRRFDVVLSGHYHHKSAAGNIHYLGAPSQYCWTDFDDPRGFHIFDTETRELTFIENPTVIFKKVFYDDRDKTIDEVTGTDFTQYQDCYVKVVVVNKDNPYWFDLFIAELEKVGVADLQIVDDHNHMDEVEDADIISEAEDTITIFNRFIDQVEDMNIDKGELKDVVSELYRAALELE